MRHVRDARDVRRQAHRPRADDARRSACRRAPARCSATRGRSSSRRRSRWAACSTANRFADTRSSRSRRMAICPNADQYQAQRKLVRQRVLHQHGRARASGQPAALSRRVLRRRQHLGASARLRSDATVPRCRIRRLDRHSAGTAGHRSGGMGSTGSDASGARIPSGKCTSSSVRSSNLEFSCVPSSRGPVALAALGAWPASRRRRRPARSRYVKSQALLERRPAAPRPSAVRRRRGQVYQDADQADERFAQRLVTKFQKDEPTLTAAAKDTQQKEIQAKEAEFQRAAAELEQKFDAAHRASSWQPITRSGEEGDRRHPRRRRLRDDLRRRDQGVGDRRRPTRTSTSPTASSRA